MTAAAVEVERPGTFQVQGDDVRWCAAPLASCAEAPGGVVSSAGPLLWALGPPGAATRATRLALGDSGAVPLALPRAGGVAIDVAAGTGPLLVRAVSQGGQPGLAVERPGALRRSEHLAVGTRSAIAVSIAEGPLAVLAWNATPGPGDIAADVEAARFRRAPEEDAARHREGTLETGVARVLKMDEGWKRVRLALTAGVAAALSRDGDVTSVHWAEAGPVAETVETDADRLTLFPPREGPGRYALEVFALETAGRTPPLVRGGSFEAQPSRSSILRLTVPKDAEPSRVHVRGASGDAVFVSEEGEVRRGRDLEVPPSGGTLLLPHGAGLVVAVREPRAEAALTAERPLRVRPPESVPLRGPAQTLRVDPDAPALLHVRAPGPAVTTVRRPGEEAVVELHPEGVLLDAYVPGAPAEVTIRAVAGGTLGGFAEVTTTPVLPIGEGLGPEVLLGPGEARLFSFTVAHAGAIGVGVRADADRVDVTLLTASGRPLGKGSMQMPTLEAGAYLLALTSPADAPPVRARPAVVGLVPPDTGPPEDVVRQYVQAPEEEVGTSFTARPAESTPEPDMEGVEAEGEGEGVPPEEPMQEDTPAEGEPEPPDTDGAAAEGGLS